MMIKTIQWVVLSVMVLISSGCASDSIQVTSTPTPVSPETIQEYWRNPLPTPAFLNSFTVTYGESTRSDKGMCVDIAAAGVWHIGDNADGLYQTVRETMVIVVDGQLVRDVEVTALAIAVIHGDEGSQGGDMSACFDVEDIDRGLHIARIEFQDTQHNLYTHTWAFEVNR